MRFISLTSFNRYVLVMEKQFAYCEVRVTVLSRMQMNVTLQNVE
jgi:hypothetical protein